MKYIINGLIELPISLKYLSLVLWYGNLGKNVDNMKYLSVGL